YGNGLTIGWFQNVVRGQHQHTCFCLSFWAQWQVDCHLVTVEVSVECSTNQWVQLDSFTFHQLRFECLDTKAVQGGCTVEQYRVFGNDFFEHVPNLWTGTFYHALCRLDVLCMVEINQALHHEWFEQFQCHLFWQTGLVQLQLWTNHDN